MGCPQCGGTARDPIAPGYWRCTTQHIETTVQQVQHGRPWLGPDVQHYTLTCGHEYQEGVPAMSDSPPVCDCGTFAIGICQACSKPVCGPHSTTAHGPRECVTHVRERVAEAQREENERLVREAKERKRAEQEEEEAWDAAVEEASRIAEILGSHGAPESIKLTNVDRTTTVEVGRKHRGWLVATRAVTYEGQGPSGQTPGTDDHTQHWPVVITADGMWGCAPSGKGTPDSPPKKMDFLPIQFPLAELESERLNGMFKHSVYPVGVVQVLRRIAERNNVQL